ncbi:unnamed protein product [Somion occarium]|uniref:Proteasome activator complex subunit 3 n=1 Tax=Somion occarium TaxID=3059160 RepID=A0ABP1CEX6_9APHY
MSNKMKMDKETSKKLEDFHNNAAKVADEILFRTFPDKIIELQELIDSTSSPSSIFHPSHAIKFTDATVYPPPTSLSTAEGPETKKRKLNGDSPSSGNNGSAAPGSGITLRNDASRALYPNLIVANQHMKQVHETVKKECEQLADLCDKVKLWVNLSMPKIEDGDNFGVQIQEEVLNELHRSQESAYNLRDASRQHVLQRAKICSKILKYPHLEDYTMSLIEHDEKQLYTARQNLFDLRNVYAILTDILHKNINKIRTPKGNNSFGLY